MANDTDAHERLGWREQLQALDASIYAAVAATPTPTFDRVLGSLSRAANHSALWMGAAAALTLSGGPRGRRAAASGIASLGVTSAVVNLGLKPLGRRRRPDRIGAAVPITRHVVMPRSTSFPSGHSVAVVDESVSRICETDERDSDAVPDCDRPGRLPMHAGGLHH